MRKLWIVLAVIASVGVAGGAIYSFSPTHHAVQTADGGGDM